MPPYNLQGIPSDLLNSDVEYKRRLKVDTTSIGEQRPLFFSRLKDANGNDNLTVDGSTTPVEFYIQPNKGEIIMIARWMIFIQDSKGFDITSLGSNGSLANGLDIQLNGQSLLGYTIKSNGDIASIAYDMTLHTFGNADDILTARWTFTNAGQYIRLTENDKLSVIVQDDLTSIVNINIQSQGYYELTQQDSFGQMVTSENQDFITSDSENFNVINPNPYKR